MEKYGLSTPFSQIGLLQTSDCAFIHGITKFPENCLAAAVAPMLQASFPISALSFGEKVLAYVAYPRHYSPVSE